MKTVLNILAILAGLMFIANGLNKFFHFMPVPEDLPESMLSLTECFIFTGWLFPLIGLGEIIGGALLCTKRFRALAALMLFPILLGILFTHIFNMPSGLPIALIMAVILGWVLYDEREKYRPLFE